jgi:hypothetical protein
MAVQPTASHGVYKGLSTRSYIATSNFVNDIYLYSNVFDQRTLRNVGSLTRFSDAGVANSNCPAGRVLRENGKKLYPGAYPGISTLLVQVGDEQSFLSGFIDPNSPVFAAYSTDLPNFPFGFNVLQQAVNPTTGSNDLGAPIYTTGTLTAGQAFLNGASSLNAGTGNMPAAISVDPTNFRYFTGQVNGAGGSNTQVTFTSIPPAGATVTLLVSNSNASLTAGVYITGTNVVKTASGLLTTNGATSLSVTLLSDGTRLVETSRVVNAS